MSERPRQAVGVFLTLVGFQEVAVGAHHLHTDEATVGVRLGRALIYLHDPMTATQFARTWEVLSEEAKCLPREIHPSLVAPLKGVGEPAVVIDARAGLSMTGHLVRQPGAHSRLQVVMGRMVFDVRDVGAYSSVTAAFRQAADLGRSAFAGGERLVPSHEAAARQAAALLVPSRSKRRVVGAKRQLPLVPEPRPRAVLRQVRGC